MTIRLNGEPHELDAPLTVAALLAQLEIDPRRVAVEHNLVVLKRGTYGAVLLQDGDEVQIMTVVSGGAPDEPRMSTDQRIIAGTTVNSTVIAGTGSPTCLAGRNPRKRCATATSPVEGMVGN